MESWQDDEQEKSSDEQQEEEKDCNRMIMVMEERKESKDSDHIVDVKGKDKQLVKMSPVSQKRLDSPMPSVKRPLEIL